MTLKSYPVESLEQEVMGNLPNEDLGGTPPSLSKLEKKVFWL